MLDKIVVTGHKAFLDRYRGFADALSNHFGEVSSLSSGNLVESLPSCFSSVLAHTPLGSLYALYQKRALSYELRSRQTEKKIARLGTKPDFVIHIFSLFGPFWKEFTIPYAMYLDFTMGLARKEWPPWAPYKKESEFTSWFVNERKSYCHATLIFTMGQNCKDSLVSDYDIPADKICVVGSSANFRYPYSGNKSFGTKQILFQGSEFWRKGGDLVLDAFRAIRNKIPHALLIIVGTNLRIDEPGVFSLGWISREQIKKLLLSSDLVLAPARCDPFSAFVIEAMNYGVPTIVTKSSGISELIKNYENGVVLQSQNPISIASAATELLASPTQLEHISRGAKRLVRERLNWDYIADQVATAIRQTNELGCTPVPRPG